MDTLQNSQSSFRELRLAANVRQGEVAKVLNVDRNAVARSDHGRRPRRKYLPGLAQLFGLDLSEAGTLFRKLHHRRSLRLLRRIKSSYRKVRSKPSLYQ